MLRINEIFSKHLNVIKRRERELKSFMGRCKLIAQKVKILNSSFLVCRDIGRIHKEKDMLILTKIEANPSISTNESRRICFYFCKYKHTTHSMPPTRNFGILYFTILQIAIKINNVIVICIMKPFLSYGTLTFGFSSTQFLIFSKIISINFTLSDYGFNSIP